MIFEKMFALGYALLLPAFALCQRISSPSHLLMCPTAGGVLMHIDLVVKYLLVVIYGAQRQCDPNLFVTTLRNKRLTSWRRTLETSHSACRRGT